MRSFIFFWTGSRRNRTWLRHGTVKATNRTPSGARRKRRDWTLRGRLMRRRAIKSMDLKKLRARTKNCVATRSKPKLHAINRHGKHGGRHQDNRCSTDTRNTRRLSFSGPHLRSREEHSQIFSSWNAHEQVSCSRRDQVQQAHSPVTMFSSKTSQHHQSFQRRQKHTGGDLDSACRQASQRVCRHTARHMPRSTKKRFWRHQSKDRHGRVTHPESTVPPGRWTTTAPSRPTTDCRRTGP